MARIDAERLRYWRAIAKLGPDRDRLPLLPRAGGGATAGRSTRCPRATARALRARSTSGPASSSATPRSSAATSEPTSSTSRSIQWFVPWFHHACSAASTRSCASPTTSRACTAWRTGSASTTRRGAETTGHRTARSARPSRRWRRPRSRLAARRAGGAIRSGTCAAADAAVATLWTSAYPVMRFNRDEGQVLLRAGLRAGLLPGGSAARWPRRPTASASRDRQHARAWPRSTAPTATRRRRSCPAVDTERYHPPPRRPDDGAPVRVFFYGRPSPAAQRVRPGPCRARRGQGALRRPGGDRLRRRGLESRPVRGARRDREPRRLPLERSPPSIARATSGSSSCSPSIRPTSRSSSWPPAWSPSRTRTPPPRGSCATRRTRSSRRRCRRWWPSRSAGRRGPELRERLAATALAEVRAIRWEDQIERVWGAITKRGRAVRRASGPLEQLGDPRGLAVEDPEAEPDHDRGERSPRDQVRQPADGGDRSGAVASTTHCAPARARGDRVVDHLGLDVVGAVSIV